MQLLLIFNIVSCNRINNSSYATLEETIANSFDKNEVLKTFISDDVAFVILHNKNENVSYDICCSKDDEWYLISGFQKNIVELDDCNGVVEHIKIGDKNYVIAMSSLHKSNEFLICDTENNLFEAYSYTSADDIKTAVFFTQVENFNDLYYLYFMSNKIDFENKSSCINVNKNDIYTGIKNWEDGGVQLNLDYEIDAIPALDKKTAHNISDEIIFQIQKSEYYKNYYLQKTFYDLEDNVWIMTYWSDTENAISEEIQIAIDAITGEVRRIWSY